MLAQIGGALERVRKNVIPQVTPPTSLEGLIEVFGAELDPLEGYHRERTCARAEVAFMLAIAHGVKADFDKVVSGFPRKVKGKPADIVSAREEGKRLSQKMADMLETRTLAKAAAKGACSASTGTGAASGTTNE